MPKTNEAEQTALTGAAHIKFTGMSLNALDSGDLVNLGDRQTFTVIAECIGDGREKRKDGEVRIVRRMEVLDVTPGEITAAEEDPQLTLDDGADDEL